MKDERKTITCRVCLGSVSKRSTKYLSLFESYNDCSIAEKIKCIADVEIKQGDGLPDRICPECLVQLENAVDFKRKCENSNVFLHNSWLIPDASDRLEVEIKKEDTTGELELEEIDWLEADHSEPTVKQELEQLIENASEESPIKQSRNSSAVECHDCGGVFTSKCRLRIHWRAVHQPEQLTCPSCKRLFKSYKAFHVHRKKKPRSCAVGGISRIEGRGKSRIFHCTECEYNTKRLKDMEYHQVIHTGNRQFPCNKCPKEFTQMSSLQAHQESVHKVYLLETTCQYCGKHIKGRNRLYRHIRTHTVDSVQCDVCKKTLKCRQSLIMHMTRHTGVKAFSCEICAKTFYTNAELSNHRSKVHYKKKVFECDICGYTMHRADQLRKHKAKHTATNTICLVCGIFVESKDMLVIHQRRHFEKNLQCPHCDMTFFNRNSRSKHVRTKHRCTMLVNKASEPSGKTNNLRIKKECPSEKQYDNDAFSISHTEVVSE